MLNSFVQVSSRFEQTFFFTFLIFPISSRRKILVPGSSFLVQKCAIPFHSLFFFYLLSRLVPLFHNALYYKEMNNQPDWPNSQTLIALIRMWGSRKTSWDGPANKKNINDGMLQIMCCIFFAFVTNTIAYHLGRYSLHLLLLQSSMIKLNLLTILRPR